MSTKPKKINMVIYESEEPPIPIETELSEITDNLETLQELTSSDAVSMTDILELYKSINSKIEEISKRTEKVKNDFNNIKPKQSKNIDTQTFQKYIKEINTTQYDSVDDVEELIESYKAMSVKINLCENYLKSQQLNLVYCDLDK